MPRIYLSVEEALFQRIAKDAAANKLTINLLIQTILEKIYFGASNDQVLEKEENIEPLRFNYVDALDQLINDTKALDDGEFTLSQLNSFKKLCVAAAEKGYLQPATLRARLGKLYNSSIANNRIPCVHRARVNGKLKFEARAAVYVKDSKNSTNKSVDTEIDDLINV